MSDRNGELIWFYFLPTIAVAFGGFAWLFLTLRYRFRWLQVFVFITVISCFIKLLVIDHRWNRPPEQLSPGNVRILHWNTARGVLGVERIVRTMVSDNPDIVLISEPPRPDMISDIAYHALGMEFIFSDAGMSLASHYPITYLGNIIVPAGAGWHALVQTDKGPIEFAAVDIVSRPELHRQPVFDAVAKWIDARTNNIPLIVAGDFNTPHDAASLKPIRNRLKFAYYEGGRGWPYTWPVPLPVYNIDHTWISHDINVHDYHLKRARYSDHMRQLMDISFPDRRPTHGIAPVAIDSPIATNVAPEASKRLATNEAPTPPPPKKSVGAAQWLD